MILWREQPAREVPPVLDTAYLERLQKHLGADVTRELMADGMLELADRLNRLPGMAAERKTDDIARLTHDVAGSAGHLGLSRLSFHATEANRALRDEPGTTPAATLEDIIAPMLSCQDMSLDALGAFCRKDETKPENTTD